MRPSEKLIIEKKRFKEDEMRREQNDKKLAAIKRNQAFSTKNLERDFETGMSFLKNQTRKVDFEQKKRQVRSFKNFIEAHKKRIFGKNGKQDFEQHRKEIEEQIENGATFSHLSKKYPMKREWAKQLDLLR